MPFVVVYDANALYGDAQRDLLIRIAQSGLVQAKWTEQILDEMLSNLGKKRPDIPADRLSILRERMNMAVRDCLVTDMNRSSNRYGFPISTTGMCLPRLSKAALRSS